jgi:AmiR/NasT family two-component response regulator
LAQEVAEAMRSHAVIEQAKGILGNEKISADEAFRRLVSLSQSTNAKLRQIASDLVAERTGPHEEV